MSLGTGLLKCSNLIGIIQRFVIWSISNKPKVLEALTWKAFNLGKSLPSLLLYQCNHLLKIVSKEFQLSFIFMYLRNNESLYKNPHTAEHALHVLSAVIKFMKTMKIFE